jgi:hypothetical protein
MDLEAFVGVICKFRHLQPDAHGLARSFYSYYYLVSIYFFSPASTQRRTMGRAILRISLHGALETPGCLLDDLAIFKFAFQIA